MDKINRILNHPLFIQYMSANAEKEKERIFCRHNLEHVTDVARIAYILNSERKLGFSKDMLYGAALLHDIGRHVQYETGEKHAAVSAVLAPQILSDCGYSEAESAKIVCAISTHSDKSLIGQNSLNGLLAEADRLSRACYSCPAAKQCGWSDERKNKQLLW